MAFDPFTSTLLGIGSGLLKNQLQKPEMERKKRLDATAARYSPYTGDNSFYKNARQHQPTALESAISSGFSGYQFGKSEQDKEKSDATNAKIAALLEKLQQR